MPDGGFDVLGLMQQAARGPIGASDAAPAVAASPVSGGAAGAPFDVLDLMRQASKGKLEDVAPPAPKGGGVLKNIGASLAEGSAGIMNVLADPFSNLIGKPLATAAVFAHDALAPKLGYQRFSDDVRNGLLGNEAPQPGTRAVNAMADVTGMPRPDTIPTVGPAETAARIIPGAALAGGALAPAGAGVAVPAAATAVGALTGQAAESAAPDWAAPMAGLAGNVTGGAAAVGGLTGAGALVREAATRPAGFVGVGRKTEIPAEGGDPIRATNTQMQAAAQRLSDAAGQSGPDGVQRFNDALANNQQELVPGSQPTTAQVAPLPGIAKLEDTVRARDGAAFMARDAAQNQARVGAIQATAPATWDPAAIGAKYRQMLDALENDTGKDVAKASGSADQAMSALGTPKAPDVVGQAVRGAVEDVRKPIKAQIGALYDAIDPDGTLALPVVNGREAAAKVMGEVAPGLQSMLPAPERALLDQVSSFPDVMKFNDVRQYISKIGDLQREFGKAQGWESQPVRRLTIVKSALTDDIQAAAERVATDQAHAVSAGILSVGESILGQINDLEGPNAAQTLGTAGEGSGGIRRPAEAGVAPNSVHSNDRGQGSGGGQPGTAPGNSGVAALEAARGRAPQSLSDFLIAKGGVQDQSGELHASDLHLVHHKAGGRLVNPRGMTLDAAREAAAEEGFIGPNSDINDFLDAVTSRKPVYRISEQADASIRSQQARVGGLNADAYRNAGYAVSEIENEAGLRLSQAEHDQASRLVAEQRMHPEDAVRQVTTAGDNEVLQRHAERNAIGSPGVPPGAQQADMLPPAAAAEPALEPNFPPEKAAQLGEANRRFREYSATFKQGPTGAMLKSGSGGAKYAQTDTAVGANVLRPENLKAYLKASSGSPDAVAAVQDALLADIRNKNIVQADGTVNSKRLADWVSGRQHTLDQVPEIADKFRDASAAQAALDEAGAARTAKLKEFQTAVAKRFLNDDPEIAVAKVLKSQDRIKGMQEIISKINGDADATASLKGHVVDYILDRLTSSPKASEAGAAHPSASEIGNIRPDTFKDWVGENKPWLRRLFGGQGMQNLEMVAADLKRQQLRGIASSGSPTAERGLAVGLGNHGGGTSTILAVVGSQLAEHLAESAGAHGVVGMAAAGAGAALPILMHALHQRGVTTVNALLREAMLNPDVAKLLMNRAQEGRVGPVMQRRIAAALLATPASQKDSPQ